MLCFVVRLSSVLIALCVFPAAVHPADVPAHGTFEGNPSITISNGRVAVTVLLTGSTLANLVLVDDSEAPSPLWNPIRMARERGRTASLASGAGHFVCVDGFGPVSAEERAAGLPGHGEAHLQIFDVRTSKDGPAAEVAMTAKLPIVQEVLTRTLRLVDGESVLYVDSRLENLMGFDRPVNWAEHATVGSPFLESGATVFDISGARSRTRPYPQQAGAAETQRRLAPGKDFTWPMAPGLDGTMINLRTTPDNPHYLDHTTTLLDTSRRLEWATALNVKKHLILGYLFRREDYPWLQTWSSYPPTQKLAHGMEFSTQPYDVPRREVIGAATMFDAPVFRWLPAKSAIETHFLVFYTRVPDGFTKVDDVRLDNRQIVIEDREAQKRVTLAASRPL